MIYENILETIGNTPLVRYDKNIVMKLEFFNPSGSVKDRASLYMLKEAKKSGEVNDETVIIEPTSGNTGIGLAMCCAVMGLRIIIVMPEDMSDERKKLIAAYGAELVLTPKEKGMQGAVDKAIELSSQIKNSYIPFQFKNPSNPKAHVETTSIEILKAAEGNIDIAVAGVGTGGTSTGLAYGLKAIKPDIKVFAVEPKESPLISEGKSGPHKIQGIGANFVPEIFERDKIDGVITISSDEAIAEARDLAKTKGILGGFSSGANLAAAKKLAKDFPEAQIVTIICDFGERYLSTELYEC